MNYIILYYAASCIHCKILLNQVEDIANILSKYNYIMIGFHQNIRVCKIDAHLNDIENLPYVDIPYLTLYTREDK